MKKGVPRARYGAELEAAIVQAERRLPPSAVASPHPQKTLESRILPHRFRKGVTTSVTEEVSKLVDAAVNYLS